MLKLPDIRNYIIIKDRTELSKAKSVQLCRFIILEQGNMIYIWRRENAKWFSEKYTIFDDEVSRDYDTTGLKAYQSFYNYCGKEEVDKMKLVYNPMDIWESVEQMHYANYEYANEKIYKNIYEFDANSAFTYGTLQLPNDFDKLKEYMMLLYEQKRIANNKITRNMYKNLQNYLVGYFARIKQLIAVRSEIIRNSNFNIHQRMSDIINNKGIVYLSNTDSIVTDDNGAKVMKDFIGDDVGKFKLKNVVDRLYYRSPNAYQIGDKVMYSGIKYFARKNTDFFEDKFAQQTGHLIEKLDFVVEDNENYITRLCRVRYGEIKVTIFNQIGELVGIKKYKIN